MQRHEEFVAQQNRAIAAARAMQRRAKLPVPPMPAPATRRPELHHHLPPRATHNPAPQWGHARMPSDPASHFSPHHRFPPAPAAPPRQKSRPAPRANAPQRPPQRHGAPQPIHRNHAPRQAPLPPPPCPNAPPPKAAPFGFDLFSLLGGLGGSRAKHEPTDAPPPNEPDHNDGMLLLLLVLLLQSEQADQGLLLALLYILF